ncbi:hypothetical protein [Dactylosporangium sp. CA-092794]|uniref:hypothetical protein n=1 Tax=Dactylosporangium sp. CA-092794 TaxID=3239929 RepID=UPI003D940C15
MTPNSLSPESDPHLAAVAGPLAEMTGLLHALDAPGCDGISCRTPAFHDRSTSTWRHFRDLTRCNADRPLPDDPRSDNHGPRPRP